MSDFWARRKAAVEAEAKAELQSAADQDAIEQQAELEALSDAEILEKLELPDPDMLNEGDDFKVFWGKAVPSRIRTRAMRRLWRVNPILANVDGLIDYGEDFTDAALVVEGMETAYQVGKGMTAHVEELARQAAEKEAAELQPPEDEACADELLSSEPVPVEISEGVTVSAETATAALDDAAIEDDDDLPPAPMGRMRFRFEETAQT